MSKTTTWLAFGIFLFFIAWGIGFVFTPPSDTHTRLMTLFAIIFIISIIGVIAWNQFKQ